MGYEDAKANVKKTMRGADETAKETWRKADGEESASDKVANLGDDIRKELGNAGDDMSAGAPGVRPPAVRRRGLPRTTRRPANPGPPCPRTTDSGARAGGGRPGRSARFRPPAAGSRDSAP
jgi:hypothetical protein